jgi:hypothetical protein
VGVGPCLRPNEIAAPLFSTILLVCRRTPPRAAAPRHPPLFRAEEVLLSRCRRRYPHLVAAILRKLSATSSRRSPNSNNPKLGMTRVLAAAASAAALAALGSAYDNGFAPLALPPLGWSTWSVSEHPSAPFPSLPLPSPPLPSHPPSHTREGRAPNPVPAANRTSPTSRLPPLSQQVHRRHLRPPRPVLRGGDPRDRRRHGVVGHGGGRLQARPLR